MLRSRINTLLSPRHEHRILGLMLLCLHFTIWWDFGHAASRSMMLAHLGLFLLWQPLWNRQRRLDPLSTVLFIAATLAVIIWLSWPVLTFWTLLLTGFVGGRVTVGRRDRYIYLLALALLVCEILIGCIPPMVEVTQLTDETTLLFTYAVALGPIALLLMPAVTRRRPPGQQVDFLYGLNLSLLATVLAMGSLLGMYLTGAEYPVAVIQTILAIAVFLLAISWLWAPFAGFSGLGQLWERYLQNIGTPFERWLGGVTRLARQRETPEEFLIAVLDELAELPWVSGITWSGTHEGERGKPTGHRFTARAGDTLVTVHAERPMGASLMLHGRLLLHLVAHFYTAKVHELELTQQTHLRAIHETGARLTHDIKNLLQSLQVMTTALQDPSEERKQAARELIERQLPHITARLQLTLDKLQTPELALTEERSLADWWEDLKMRYADDRIGFESRVEADTMIPADLFDSVVENLLENARLKRAGEPDIRIEVKVRSNRSGTTLQVADSGTAVDPEVAKSLFNSPVESRTGFGIGLYQSARLAREMNYRLALVDDGSAGVCFELSGQPTPADA